MEYLSNNLKLKVLFFLSILIGSLPAVIFMIKGYQKYFDARTQVFALSQDTSKKDKLRNPDFAKGEIIIKLKTAPKTLDSTSLPASLQAIDRKYKILKAVKVFADKETPDKELTKIKQKFADELKSGKRRLDEQRLAKIDLSRTFKIIFEKDVDLEAVINELSQNPEIEAVQPNFLAYAFFTPNDPLYPQQYSMQLTQAELAWDITTGSTEAKIAVIDTGMDLTHEDLTNSLIGDCATGCTQGSGYDFVDIDLAAYQSYGYTAYPGEDYTVPDNLPTDKHGHGTHVSGIIAAQGNNAKGVSGICPGCKLMPVKAGFALVAPTGGVIAPFEYDDIAKAINYAAENGAQIISMSFGGREDNLLVKAALDMASAQGVLLIAAAGNDSSSVKHYPAAHTQVMAVTATDNQDRKAEFTSYGLWTGVAAPGVDILSTVPKTGSAISDSSGYKTLSGTSMSAPYVAGLAGLILSVNPNWTNSQLTQIITENTNPPQNTQVFIGTGRVNSYQSVSITSLSAALTEITSPKLEDYISGPVSITGNALGDSYMLSFGSGLYPQTWTEIASGTTVNNGNLGLWNNAGLAENSYTLRLITYKNNLPKTYSIHVGLDRNIHIGWPKQLNITHFGSDNDNSLTPVLADLDLDGIQDIILRENTQVHALKHDGSYISGWPSAWKKPHYTWQSQVPAAAIADLNQDCIPEVAASNTEYPQDAVSCFNLFNNAGQALSSPWPKFCRVVSGVQAEAKFSQMTFYDLDSNGTREIITMDTTPLTYGVNYSQTSRHQIYVFNADGTNFRNWPYSLPPEHLIGSEVSNLTLIDIEKDGLTEIVGDITFNNTAKNTIENLLYIWNYDGTIRTGYPKKITNPDLNNPYSTTEVYKGLVSADIGNDGQTEMLYSTYIGSCAFENLGKLRYQKPDGSFLNSFLAKYTQRINPADAVTADINHDGKIETVVGTHDESRNYLNKQTFAYCGGEVGYKVYVFSDSGANLPGWPQTVIGEVYSQPAIADITNDNNPEILVSTTQGYVYAWNKDGTLISAFPKKMHPGHTSTSGVAIGDIDGDAKVEIVASSEQGKVYVWDMDALYKIENLEWPMYQHDAYSTGNYHTSLAVPPLPGNCTQPTLTNTPVPPTPTVNISSELILNPGFETDANNDNKPDKWSTNNKFTKSSVNKHAGIFSGRHYSTANSGYSINQTLINISGSASYTFSGWTNIPQTSDAFTYKLQLIWKNSSGKNLRTDTLQSFTKATSGWQQTTAVKSAPANAVSVIVRMNVVSLNATIYTDDFSLTKL